MVPVQIANTVRHPVRVLCSLSGRCVALLRTCPSCLSPHAHHLSFQVCTLLFLWQHEHHGRDVHAVWLEGEPGAHAIGSEASVYLDLRWQLVRNIIRCTGNAQLRSVHCLLHFAGTPSCLVTHTIVLLL
jgi:hypothetical protein